jgi:MYXO-CTERM domain-containing protein
MTRLRFVPLCAALVAMGLGLPALAQAGQHWGQFQAGNCNSDGNVRQYGAQLYDIPWGVDWTAACQNMPADIVNASGVSVHFAHPTKCVNRNGEWGEFDMAESCTPHYEVGCDASVAPGPHPRHGGVGLFLGSAAAFILRRRQLHRKPRA